jgi:Protein of unknown function (DUF4230)
MPQYSDITDRPPRLRLPTDRFGRRRGRWLMGAMAGVLVLLAIIGITSLVNIWPGFRNPFAERDVDRSQPVLLQSIRDLSRFEGASGNFQVVVDLEKDAGFLPSFIRGERTLFIGAGSVDAYVDFSRIGEDGVTVSSDQQTATIRLPSAQLEEAALDNERSYVFAQQRGFLNRVEGFFSSNPDSQRQVYALAQQKITTAARESELVVRAEQNTRLMLEGLLRSLGFEKVTVVFTPPSK